MKIINGEMDENKFFNCAYAGRNIQSQEEEERKEQETELKKTHSLCIVSMI